jgi:hypothetical protein
VNSKIAQSKYNLTLPRSINVNRVLSHANAPTHSHQGITDLVRSSEIT